MLCFGDFLCHHCQNIFKDVTFIRNDYNLQLSHSSPANFGGSYFGQNMTKKNISATSVLLNYPKVCPLTKKNCKIYILGDMKNDKIAVARSLCVGLIRSRKETPIKIKFYGGSVFWPEMFRANLSEIQQISHF